MLKLSTILVMLSLWSSSISAETLEQAWAMALAENFKIQAAAQDQLAAQEQLDSARAQRLPSITLGAEYLRLDSPPTFSANFGMASPLSVTYWDEESAYYGALTTLPLYTGGRISADIEAAKAQQSAISANASNTVSSVKITVVQAYLDVLRGQSAVVLAESHVKSVTSHKNDVNNLRQQGLVARNHLLMAKVALAGAKQELLQSEHRLQMVKVGYNRQLNRPLDTVFELEPINLPPTTQTLSELNEEALTQRADLQVLKYRAEALLKTAEVAKAASKPQVSLSGTYLHHNNRILIDNDVFAAQVSMTWKVFDGGVSGHHSNKLQRQATSVKALEAELKGIVEMQVTQAWLALEAAQKRQRMTSINIEQAEENLTSSKNRYQAGLITSTEVLEAEKFRIQAYTDHDNANYDAAFATLQIKHVAGIL
ncbi:MAG: TolC family protein [Flavobacteriales bacterium]|nr:TolC family protein [Flavobacteriales bacterium]